MTSGHHSSLASTLRQLDGASYGAYKRLHGEHTLPAPAHAARLLIDKVQSDPFAPPSLIRVELPLAATGIAPELCEASSVAVCDHLTRRLARAISRHNPKGGKQAGFLAIDAPGQQVLHRASVAILGRGDDATVSVRMEAALPARGRRILGRAASTLLTTVLPSVLDHALLNLSAADLAALEDAVTLYVDQQDLRAQLAEQHLVGCLADGAILPRAAGNSDLPMEGAQPLTSPASLRRSFTLASGRNVVGMGIPEGVTLIVGGGYHGKSTLLKALELGVYHHIAGDGREFALARDTAVALRAEDGRSVAAVNVSPFINDLPTGTDTQRFSTANASGSTSQAASLMEALESGATVLLIDEDTSATNFMIRDDRMRRLVPAPKEPITPLVDRVRELWEQHGISTVLVAGGSGAFLDVADTVIMMDSYQPNDATERAQSLAQAVTPPQLAPLRLPTPRAAAALGAGSERGRQGGRRGDTHRGHTRGGRGPKPPQGKGLHAIRIGDHSIDLTAISQLIHPSQTNAIAAMLALLAERTDGHTPLVDLVDELCQDIEAHGIDAISRHRGHPGHLALPRPQEVLAAVNRYRALRIK